MACSLDVCCHFSDQETPIGETLIAHIDYDRKRRRREGNDSSFLRDQPRYL